MQAGHGLAHFSHRRTEIASFEPCGDINEGRKVFAGKLLLPGHDRNVGDLSHPDDMTIRRSERTVQLVRLAGSSFYATLRHKFGWSGGNV